MINSKITKDALLNVGRQIKEGLENDGLKWFRPFLSESFSDLPKNAITGYEYNGINFWNLSFVQLQNKYKLPLYASQNAWKKVGGIVKAEEIKKSHPIFYWWRDVSKKVKNDDGKEQENKSYVRWFLKITWGYNADQIDLSNSTWSYPKADKKAVNKVKDIKEIQNFVNGQKGLELKHSNESRCYYSPTLDYIHMTNKKNFIKTENGTDETFEYYSTLLHELIHWSGHEKRTNRFNKNKNLFKDNSRKEYALEELNAEIGANILCIQFDLQKTVNQNSLAYLASWKKYLSDDDVFIYKALSQSAGAIQFLKDNLKTAKAKKTA